MSAATFNPYAYYDPSRDAMRGGWGGQENAAGRYERWLRDAQNLAASRGYALTPEQQTALRQRDLGGIRWAEEQGGGGASGFNWGGYDPSRVYANTYNSGEAVENIVHGTVPQHAGSWGTADQQQATSGPATPGLGDFLGQHLSTPAQLLYQAHPELAWAAQGRQFSPNVASPRADWWSSRWPAFNAEYTNQSVLQPNQQNLQFTDFLTSRFPQLAQEFDLLPAQARGINAPYLPAGRPQL